MEISEGISFAEESCGTNAIAISMKLKKKTYTLPGQHYCDFLRKSHFYSVPLDSGEKPLGYLAVATTGQAMKKELLAITNLLAHRLTGEYINKHKITALCGSSRIKLSDKQLNVLRFLATGMTDKAAAIELRLSFDTVRYHKKNIFSKLGVNCTVEAVVKALKLNLISLEQIKI